jgi:glycosyltransferase involved in cell wall biosynthesis
MQELGDDFVLNYTGGPVAEKAKTSMPANMQDLGRLNKDGVIKAMQTSDALLFPSRSEGFSLVVIEAMACGLPVIATRGSSLSEAIEDNVSGILCNMDDVASFVKAVKKISNDDRLRHQISHQAHSRAENKFTQLKMVSRYQAIYSNDKNQN